VELNSGNLGSQCEAVIAVLQRADEFQGGTSARGVTVDVTGLELAEVCQQSHVSVMDVTVFPLKDLIPRS